MAFSFECGCGVCAFTLHCEAKTLPAFGGCVGVQAEQVHDLNY